MPEQKPKSEPYLLAVDAGNLTSGVLRFVRSDELGGITILSSGQMLNEELLKLLETGDIETAIFEMPKPRGELASGETFETCWWVGRFCDAADRRMRWSFIFHQQTALSVCRSGAAKDKQIRRALIELFGGEQAALKGSRCKRCKGTARVDGGRMLCLQCTGQREVNVPTTKNCSVCGGKQGGICEHCDAAGKVVTTKKKLCPGCKGKADVAVGRVECPDCSGSGWGRTAGPLATISTHCWSALAVAITWLDMGEPEIHRVVSEKK